MPRKEKKQMDSKNQHFREWPLAERISLIVQITVFACTCIVAPLMYANNNWNVYADVEDNISLEATNVVETEKETTTTTTSITTTEQTTTTQESTTTEETTTETTETTSETTTEETTTTTTTTVMETLPQTMVETQTEPQLITEVETQTEPQPITEVETQTEPQPITEIVDQSIVDEFIETTSEDNGMIGSVYPVTEYEYVLLCNLVAREYGANYVSEAEKAKVVEVVFNRRSSSSFPDTIYGVLTQRYQFSGYVAQSTFTSKVTTSVKTAVTNYLNGCYTNHGYLYFWGDGRWNHFS